MVVSSVRVTKTNKLKYIVTLQTNLSTRFCIKQMLENKQKFISQVMTSKTPVRVCSDIDEQALDYAEVKALCAGSLLIKREMELQILIKDLKMDKARYSEKIYELQDNIRVKIPNEIMTAQQFVLRAKADFNTANSAPAQLNEEGHKVYPIEIYGETYTDRKAGGDAIRKAMSRNSSQLMMGRTIEIGEYRDLKLSLVYDTFRERTKACLAGEKFHYCELNSETDIGNMKRLDNCIDNIERSIAEAEEKVTVLQSELVQMKADVIKPFPKAQELLEAETELEDVHEQLTQFELTDDSMHKQVFERLCENFMDVMTGKKPRAEYMVGDDPRKLTVELKGDVFSMSRSYMLNYEMKVDPLVCFKVDYKNEKVTPISMRSDKEGINVTYDIANVTAVNVKDINNALNMVDDCIDDIEEKGINRIDSKEIMCTVDLSNTKTL